MEIWSLYSINIVSHYLLSYDLEFTVSQNLIAVSAGSLLYQVREIDENILLLHGQLIFILSQMEPCQKF